MHTLGPWAYRKFDETRLAIVPSDIKNGTIIGLVQMPGVGGPISDAERAANIKLIKEAPAMFEVIGEAHDLCLDGKCKEARELLAYILNKIEEESFSEGGQ